MGGRLRRCEWDCHRGPAAGTSRSGPLPLAMETCELGADRGVGCVVARGQPHNDELGHLAWMAAWAVTSAIVIVQGGRGRWSVLIIAAAWLGWPAYVATADDLWSWVLFAWLALAVAAPPFRSWVDRPMWSTRAALAGNIFGNPAWHRTRTAAVVEQLTVIPGVRVLHRGGRRGACRHPGQKGCADRGA